MSHSVELSSLTNLNKRKTDKLTAIKHPLIAMTKPPKPQAQQTKTPVEDALQDCHKERQQQQLPLQQNQSLFISKPRPSHAPSFSLEKKQRLTIVILPSILLPAAQASSIMLL